MTPDEAFGPDRQSTDEFDVDVETWGKSLGAPSAPDADAPTQRDAPPELPALCDDVPALCDDTQDDNQEMFRELFGSDCEDDGASKGKAKAKGKGKAKAKGKGKAKATAKAGAKSKAKAKPKVRGPTVGGVAVQGPEQVQGPEVGGAQGPEQVQGPEVGGAAVQGSRVGHAKAKAKAKARGVGTFAGRRCPTDASKRKEFDELKAHYLQARWEAVTTKEETSGRKTSSKAKKERKFTENQSKYWAVMKKRMHELASEGVPGPERMRKAAAEWRASVLNK